MIMNLTATLIQNCLANKILGDDAVLRTVMKFLQKHGIKIVAIDDLLDCVVSKRGALTKVKPNLENMLDINLGMKAIKKFSDFDVGQSLVIAQKQIIAIEALEGTDEMIKRCKNLAVDYKHKAILVKMKKRKQSKKADLPTIGVTTIKNCAVLS